MWVSRFLSGLLYYVLGLPFHTRITHLLEILKLISEVAFVSIEHFKMLFIECWGTETSWVLSEIETRELIKGWTIQQKPDGFYQIWMDYFYGPSGTMADVNILPEGSNLKNRKLFRCPDYKLWLILIKWRRKPFATFTFLN